MWKCPNGCEIDYTLVCGGNFDLNNPDGPNTYFRMGLNGEYTNILEDGTFGVTDEMKNHADGGCCNEAICPDCKNECVVE